jgi:RmlD substrate binding domain.
MRRMRILVTGASGVLGRMTVPLLGERGHELVTPSSAQLDLFDVKQVSEAVHDVHMAVGLPAAHRFGELAPSQRCVCAT